MTKEHVFGDWLRAHFPRDNSTKHTFGTFKHRPENLIVREPSITKFERPGHSGTRKVRVVCRHCNNGWMSTLEESTIPILTPMIVGDPIKLSPNTQEILAAWAVKTAMVAEFVSPRGRRVSQEERAWLKDRLVPPENWMVWAAGYNGTSWKNLAIYQHRGTLQDTRIRGTQTKVDYASATTFGVSHVVFLVLGSSLDGIHQIFQNVENSTGALQLWPPIARSILWPPVRTLNDAQVNGFANILTLSRAFDQSLNPSADWAFGI